MTRNQRIKKALEDANTSQNALARHMKLSSASVSSMLSKPEPDSIRYCEAVIEMTGCNREWLYFGTAYREIEGETVYLLDDPTQEYQVPVPSDIKQEATQSAAREWYNKWLSVRQVVHLMEKNLMDKDGLLRQMRENIEMLKEKINNMKA